MFCFLSVLPLPYSNPHFCGKVPPQIRPFDFGDEASNSGETMGIQCTVIKGDLPINITWVLNNHTLNSGDLDVVIGRMSSKSSTLNIDYIAAEHRGFYTCLARNLAGESSYTAELKVNGYYPLISYLKDKIYFGLFPDFF